jgi:4'-phosphopantetheinyl transferase
LRFRTGEHGKPEIDQPAEARALRFSLSHTKGLVVCAAAWHREVGVDAERIRRDDGMFGVVDRCFDPAEAAALRALPQAQRYLRFLQHWTLKEAYAKARGLGLTLPLNQVAFEIGDAEGDIRAAFAPELGDEPSHWRFELHHIGDEHVVATAVTCP